VGRGFPRPIALRQQSQEYAIAASVSRYNQRSLLVLTRCSMQIANGGRLARFTSANRRIGPKHFPPATCRPARGMHNEGGFRGVFEKY
jgi:hypothetical protein